ncbi:zinc/manganese transport system permease protein [Tepidimonas ignava]|uniref:Manganese transport system membrane protein MntB n=1 Tax=Tepidimonas ignava TaxID=114249 RepID=A0A4R3LCQ1_9BURK|nr:metal ABC transporter permease [Tepidimonas ignava]TCS97070.1 zinc/manganese transport system permease protein [Tepidimonas ignava]TSE22304.1 Manganese transport system membrane protein MntB [Tepidimonas ignava]
MGIEAWWTALLASTGLEFDFMRRAAIGCALLALGAAPVGVLLMLRRMSLMGDAMSHAILPGAALGYLAAGLSLPAMTLGGVVGGLVVALAAGAVARHTVLREDAALAALYLVSLALGVLIISVRGTQVDLLHVLFGSVLALDDGVVALLAGVSAVTVGGLALLWRPLVMECVDPAFLRGVSPWGAWAHQGFLALVVINLVAAFHALGTLMAVGMMVLPAASARLWARRWQPMLLWAVATAAVGGWMGLWWSYRMEWPTSPTIVLLLGAWYALSLLVAPHGWWRQQHVPHRHLRG